MTLFVHNTLSRTKEAFEPLNPDHVRIYVCGPTVYNYAHIGNARPVVVFDVFTRLLRRLFQKVTYVRNITDVDDKINEASRTSGEDIRNITERTVKAFHEDMEALGNLQPDEEPRATDHIPQMIEMIETLIELGNAYEADGHVLFKVPSMDEYGQLSRHSRDELIAGARVDVAPYKQDPCDFVLWKPSDDNLPGWDSPWGRGRPGWHIECSAMSKAYLGETFDIHGGGQDLIFPHHENELAQSRCANHKDIMAKYWMHNGYLMSEGEKMSKSLGNFYTVHELLDEYPGQAIRLTLMQTHYRQPQDFTRDGLSEARRTLDKWYRLVGDEQHTESDIPAGVIKALCDDLNTPRAIAELHKLAGLGTPESRRALKAGANFMGLMFQSADDWSSWQPAGTGDVDEAAIADLIAERTSARKNRDFARSDQIRDELAAQGIMLQDDPDGTTSWYRT